MCPRVNNSRQIAPNRFPQHGELLLICAYNSHGGSHVKRLRLSSRLILAAVLAAIGSGLASAQGKFQVVTGKEFESAIPKDFYLEGNAIPTEKRNALLKEDSRGHARPLRPD